MVGKESKSHVISVLDFSKEKEQREFDEFYREVYFEIDEKYGEIEEMNVCDNTGEHMLGNVYIKVSQIFEVEYTYTGNSTCSTVSLIVN